MLDLQHMLVLQQDCRIGWIVLAAASAAAGFAQRQAAGPRFEVSSVKRCQNAPKISGFRIAPGSLQAMCLPVKFMMQAAYAPSPDASVPISGGPAWLDTDPYDVEAKAGGNPSRDMMIGLMLRELLAERFKLRVHRESKEVPVYELRVAKSGSKVQAFREGSCATADPGKTVAPSMKGPPVCGSMTMRLNAGNLVLDVHKRSLAEFSRQLHLDRPVIDKTGLDGLFDFHLEFASDGTTAGFFPPGFTPPAPVDGAVSIFTAIQEQLGLKLEPARGPGETIVIDNVERPSED